MKKFLLLIAIFALGMQSSQAYSVSKYFDHGAVYSGISYPSSVAKSEDGEGISTEGLKVGVSHTQNIFGLFEGGNAGIHAAAINGNITKIHYVDRRVDKMYVPLGFIPVYLKHTKTIVYGE